MATPVNVARTEAVTQAHLGGASRVAPAAAQTAVMEYVLDAEVPVWTAIAVVWDGGAGCQDRHPRYRPRPGVGPGRASTSRRAVCRALEVSCTFR
jgi:hypothetical protein